MRRREDIELSEAYDKVLYLFHNKPNDFSTIEFEAALQALIMHAKRVADADNKSINTMVMKKLGFNLLEESFNSRRNRQ